MSPEMKAEKKKSEEGQMEDETKRTRGVVKSESIRFHKINREELPRTDKQQLIAAKANPAVLVAWL